jgi:hypothetical protein
MNMKSNQLNSKQFTNVEETYNDYYHEMCRV